MHRPTARLLTGTAERPRLSFHRVYRTSAENLRGALTDIDRLGRWFGRIDGAPTAVGDPFTAHLGGDPGDVAAGRVLACEQDLVRVSWSWQGEAESVLTARVLPRDDGTVELRFDHALEEPQHVAGYGGGWEQMLQALARSLGAAEGDAPDDEVLEQEAVAAWRTLADAALEIEKELPAGIERVWPAFATADGLRSWWWSHWSDVSIEADVRPGGRCVITAPQIGVELSGTYLEVEEPVHLSSTWLWREESGTAIDEAVDVRLVPTGADSTLVRIRHTGPWTDGGQQAKNYRAGWLDTLDQLVTTLSR